MKEIMAKGRGKTFWKSLEAAKKRVNDGDMYLIRRHGAWFRPDAHGYTTDITRAGVFHGTVARGYLEVDGLSLVRLKSMADAIVSAAEVQAIYLLAHIELMRLAGGGI